MADWGFDTWIYEMLPIEKALERLQHFGVRYGEYSNERFDRIKDVDLLEGEVKELEDLVPSLSIRMVQMHAPYGELDRLLGSSHEGERRRGIDLVKRWLGYTNRLGVEVLVMHTAIGEQAAQSDFISAVKSNAEANLNVFSELSRHAKDCGVKVAVENRLETIFGCMMADLLTIVRADPDGLGICLDTGHAIINGISPAVAMEQTRGALIATHIHDNDGYSDQHLPPLMGIVDWADFMKAVERVSYDGPLVIEIPGSSSSLRACDNKLLLTKGSIDHGIIGGAR